MADLLFVLHLEGSSEEEAKSESRATIKTSMNEDEGERTQLPSRDDRLSVFVQGKQVAIERFLLVDPGERRHCQRILDASGPPAKWGAPTVVPLKTQKKETVHPIQTANCKPGQAAFRSARGSSMRASWQAGWRSTQNKD